MLCCLLRLQQKLHHSSLSRRVHDLEGVEEVGGTPLKTTGTSCSVSLHNRNSRQSKVISMKVNDIYASTPLENVYPDGSQSVSKHKNSMGNYSIGLNTHQTKYYTQWMPHSNHEFTWCDDVTYSLKRRTDLFLMPATSLSLILIPVIFTTLDSCSGCPCTLESTCTEESNTCNVLTFTWYERQRMCSCIICHWFDRVTTVFESVCDYWSIAMFVKVTVASGATLDVECLCCNEAHAIEI